MIDLHHVRTFCVVTETNNFTAAAERLGCSQATVTIHIQALEREVGGRLFHRHRFTRRVLLTAVGNQMLQYGCELLQLAERAASEIRSAELSSMTVDA